MAGFPAGRGLRVHNASAHGDAYHAPKDQESIAQAFYVFSVGYTARRFRPEGARKLSPGFTLGKSK
jgi:hypothetical protein